MIFVNLDTYVWLHWSMGQRPPAKAQMDVAFRNLSWTLWRCA